MTRRSPVIIMTIFNANYYYPTLLLLLRTFLSGTTTHLLIVKLSANIQCTFMKLSFFLKCNYNV